MAASDPAINIWASGLPEAITSDPLWSAEAYRIALFLSDCCWDDVSQLSNDARTKSLSDQLYRAVGSVCANIEEGYSRESGRDCARYYEYALGSAREARGWYFRARHILGEQVFGERLHLLSQVVRLLTVMARNQRSRSVRETPALYATEEIGATTSHIPS